MHWVLRKNEMWLACHSGEWEFAIDFNKIRPFQQSNMHFQYCIGVGSNLSSSPSIINRLLNLVLVLKASSDTSLLMARPIQVTQVRKKAENSINCNLKASGLGRKLLDNALSHFREFCEASLRDI